ncbi:MULTISPECIES: sulfite exporter TauE/SafE family protein [unclassified Pseudomonas]|uniref:sulfite exporter TauE/SafE family protein n=1 Tax=unclassified Pseudomonas TaxID=196821 RepID=UPI001CBC9110|nr:MULTISPECIES: sulfite exporter TauE/SafE family protein [unclassified Pseudomonas]
MLLSGIFGIAIGIILGLTGAGGGILAVPALVIGLGWSMTESAPVALFAVSAAAAVGAVDGLRKGLVRYRAALLMALLGAVFSRFGVYFAHLLPNTVLTSLFSMVMVIVAIRMIRQANGNSAKAADNQQCWQEKNCMINPQTGRLRWTPKCSASLAVVGSLSGLLTGMLGVGGGFLIVPAFQQLSDIRMHGIVATSLMTIALISAVAVTGAIHAGAHITVTGGVFIAASVSGMLLGRVLSLRIPAKSIQLGFSAVCIVVAGYLMFKTWM